MKQHDFVQYNRLSNVCTKLNNSDITAIISSFHRTQCIERSKVKKDYNPNIPLYFEYVLLFEKCSKSFANYSSKYIIVNSIQKKSTELSMQLDTNVLVKELFKVCFKTCSDNNKKYSLIKI